MSQDIASLLDFELMPAIVVAQQLNSRNTRIIRTTRINPNLCWHVCLLVVTLASSASAQFKVEKRDVAFVSGELRLAGTLYRPKVAQATPAVVLIHGSGQTDRSSLDHIAELLAKHGVSALAYDKRGVGKSQGAPTAWRDFSFDDLASDAAAGVEFLRARADIDTGRVGLFAASQGGWIAPLAAQRGGVRFLILQSPSVTTVAEDNLFERSARLHQEGFTESEVEEARQMHLVDLDVSRNGARIEEFVRLWNENKGKRWFRRVYLGNEPMAPDHRYRVWYRTVMDFDPVPLLRELAIPALWLFGDPELDRFGPVNRSVEVLEGLRKSGKLYTIHVFPGADHSLQMPKGGEAPYQLAIVSWLKTTGVLQP